MTWSWRLFDDNLFQSVKLILQSSFPLTLIWFPRTLHFTLLTLNMSTCAPLAWNRNIWLFNCCECQHHAYTHNYFCSAAMLFKLLFTNMCCFNKSHQADRVIHSNVERTNFFKIFFNEENVLCISLYVF